MKTLISIFICAGLFLGTFANTPKGDTKTSGKNPKSAKRTILIMGLKEGDITSNYFMAENIAERTSLAKDSLEPVFSRELSEGILKTENPRFDFVCCLPNKDSRELMSKINFKYADETIVADLSEVKDSDFQKFLDHYNADYVIFLDHYFLKYQGGNNLFHIVNYDVYNHDKKNIIADKTYFNSAELLPLINYEKNYKKAGAKIVQQLNKVAE